MTDHPHDTVQRLMDRAYDRWETAEWTKEQFFAQLDPLEAVAVAFGNLNYQVQNGGWGQWHGNDYSSPEAISVLKRELTRMDTACTRAVLALLVRFEELASALDSADEDDEQVLNAEFDRLDTAYYELDRQLMDEVEASLRALDAREALRRLCVAVLPAKDLVHITLENTKDDETRRGVAAVVASLEAALAEAYLLMGLVEK